MHRTGACARSLSLSLSLSQLATPQQLAWRAVPRRTDTPLNRLHPARQVGTTAPETTCRATFYSVRITHTRTRRLHNHSLPRRSRSYTRVARLRSRTTATTDIPHSDTHTRDSRERFPPRSPPNRARTPSTPAPPQTKKKHRRRARPPRRCTNCSRPQRRSWTPPPPPPRYRHRPKRVERRCSRRPR